MLLAIPLVLAVTLHPTCAARILGVFSHPVRSNSLYTHSVMSTLAAAGHDVTVYSSFLSTPDSGFNHVLIETDYQKTFSRSLKYEEFTKKFSKVLYGGSVLRIFAHAKCEAFLKHPLVQKLLYSNETFDLVITGAFFGEESMLVFGHVFGAPTIALQPSGVDVNGNYLLGNSLSLAISPDYFAFGFTDKMSLVERVQNVLSGVTSLLWYHWYDLPGHDHILQRHVSALKSPPPTVHQMVTDIALVFANVHPTINYPKPISPNIIHIGGINIKANNPPLPKDLQIIMDNATQGVIYCSLGSVIPVDSTPPQLIQAYIDAFKRFPHKVIWKISPKVLPDLPNNVIAFPWLPQQKLLEHPHLRVFLTHGGLGSQQESLRAGVPVVGLPFGSDQHYNVRMMEHLGVGVSLRNNNLTTESIYSALHTVLGDKRFAENARKMARIYADVPLQPAASVVYWTEYILRHGGKHLRPQAALLSWYQRALLDVVGLLLAALIVVIASILFLIITIYRWTKTAPKKIDTNKKKQN